jgi:LuxR family maltose regulon positive regulatory protein
MVHQARGSLKDAFSTLSEALTLAETEGYLRVFLDEGEPMRSLISDFRFQIENRMPGMIPGDQKTLLDYIHKLLVVFTVSSIPYIRKPFINDLTPSIAEPLSERELEVLHLMAAGLSNRDIANMDVVSINTVKTQVKSIYGKLGVHQREDAIAAARELHLL